MNKKLGQDAIYDARELGIPRMLLLGLQHLFAMFGATVLVPILVSGYGLPLSIQTTLLFAGIGTLLFHVCTKMKVPAFLGSSFAFLGGFEAVAQLDAGKFATMTGEEKLPYALGGIVVAGALYLILALLFKLVGPQKVMRFFPPIVTGPIIILIGLNLSGTAITNASTCWWLALVAIAIPTFNSSLNRAKTATDAANIRAGYATVMMTLLQADNGDTTNKIEAGKAYYLQKDGTVAATGTANVYKCQGKNAANGIDVAGSSITWEAENYITYTYNATSGKVTIASTTTAPAA